MNPTEWLPDLPVLANSKTDDKWERGNHVLLKIWRLHFCWCKALGTSSGLEKEVILILNVPYLSFSWLSQIPEHLPAPQPPVFLFQWTVPRQRAGWMQNTALGLLLLMLLEQGQAGGDSLLLRLRKSEKKGKSKGKQQVWTAEQYCLIWVCHRAQGALC